MAAPFKMLLLLQHQYIGGTLPVAPFGKLNVNTQHLDLLKHS
jgi:hypothetical protein